MGSNLRRAKISKLELGPGVEDKQPVNEYLEHDFSHGTDLELTISIRASI